MKTTTPTKASTPTKPTLPRIVEGCDEDTSEDVSPDGEKVPSAIDTEEEIDKQEIAVVVPVLCKAKEPSERDVRRQDYQSARMHRRASSGFSAVTGVITLFQHISEIRTDLEWVEIKAYFRQRNLSYLSWEEHMTDRSGKQPLPIVSYLLILLCSGLLVYSFYKSGWKFEKMSVNPSFGPAVDTLTDLGALSAAKIIQDNEWYRAFTATVLHGGVLHWICNAIAMAYIGPALEWVHGSCKVGLVFFAAGGAANLLSAVYAPFSISVGASGGICAWIGFALADCLIHWPLLKVLHKAGAGVISFPFFKTKLWIAFEMLLLIIVGLLPWIDNFAHLGGLFFGICIGVNMITPAGGALLLGYKTSPFYRCLQFKLQIVAICLTLALCATNVLWLYQSQDIGDLPCRNCRYYLDCVPLPSFKKFCDPCYYINDVYTTHTLDGRLGLELTCPFGDLGYVVVAEWPTKRGEWADLCHEHCEL